MSPDALLRDIERELSDHAAAQGGAVSLAGDAFHVIELLMDKPTGWRAILHWAGDVHQDPDSDTGIVDHELHLVVGLHTGMSLRPGSHLVVDRAGQPNVMSRFYTTREFLRGLRWPRDGRQEEYLRYQRSEPVVTPEGLPMAAYRAIYLFTAACEQRQEP